MVNYGVKEMEESFEEKEKLAGIQSRKEAFNRSPVWFTIWGCTSTILNIIFWIVFWSLVVQCTCDGCVWQPTVL